MMTQSTRAELESALDMQFLTEATEGSLACRSTPRISKIATAIVVCLVIAFGSQFAGAQESPAQLYQSLEQQDFAHAWQSAAFNRPLALYIRALVASHDQCRPGSSVDATILAYSALYARKTNPFDTQRNEISLSEIVNLIERLESRLSADELERIYGQMVPGDNAVYIPFPCDQSHSYSLSEGILRESLANGRAYPLAQFLCTKQSTARIQTGFLPEGSFGRTPLIKLKIDDENNYLRDHDRFVESILTVMQVWRSPCIVCRRASSSIVIYRKEFYVYTGIMPPWPIFSDVAQRGRPTSPPYKIDNLSSAILRGGGRFQTGQPLGMDFKEEFCALERDLTDDSTQSVSAAVGCSESIGDSFESSKLTVRLTNSTTCDRPGKRIVACALANNVVELNADIYEFNIGDETVVGYGGTTVDLHRVMVHESGHWLGLSHHNSGQSVMNARLGSVVCVDDETMYRVNAAVTDGALIESQQALEYSE